MFRWHHLSRPKPERKFDGTIGGPVQRSHIGDLIVIAENETMSAKRGLYLLGAGVFRCHWRGPSWLSSKANQQHDCEQDFFFTKHEHSPEANYRADRMTKPRHTLGEWCASRGGPKIVTSRNQAAFFLCPFPFPAPAVFRTAKRLSSRFILSTTPPYSSSAYGNIAGPENPCARISAAFCAALFLTQSQNGWSNKSATSVNFPLWTQKPAQLTTGGPSKY